VGILAGQGLSSHLLQRLRGGETPDVVLGSLRGNFALAWAVNGSVHLTADQTRSRTILYRKQGREVLASDDPWHVVGDDTTLDLDSVAEFATAGFVSGQHTIFQNVRALQAGERVSFDITGAHSTRYFEYRPTYDRNDSIDQLCVEHDAVIMAAMERSVASIGDRQLVVPLSAGLDSRLIAACLKRMGQERVFCFSYGRPGNPDAEGAREYAKQLGYDWHMVPYEAADMAQMLGSEKVRAFWKMCTAGVSMPFFNDYPALELMQRQEMIEPDAVFMPGQSGDFIVGSHLKYVFDPEVNPDPTSVRAAIVHKHYLMWEDIMRRGWVREAVGQRMDEILDPLPLGTDRERAGAYEYWEWQERQCKHVINEGRTYEFFGHEWRMPLWDVEVMEFWRGCTLEHKVGSYLYREYLATINPGGVFAHERLTGPVYQPGRVAIPPRQRQGLSRVPLLGHLLWLRERYRKHKKNFAYGPTGTAQAYGRTRYLFREPGKRHEGSLLLKDFLRDVYGVRIEKL
ncbi:MAG: asparagine synthase, partial [Proteobacteria bacterium]|nr:asparagine synthase [Pseudomonadota bacterium]MBU1610542.1 asparagine synthase [Pseudomonadota bacterium]